jgi:hypothetical protein
MTSRNAMTCFLLQLAFMSCTGQATYLSAEIASVPLCTPLYGMQVQMLGFPSLAPDKSIRRSTASSHRVLKINQAVGQDLTQRKKDQAELQRHNVVIILLR